MSVRTHDLVFDIQVCVQRDGLDGLKTGAVCTDHVFVRVMAGSDAQAGLAACQMAGRHGTPTRTTFLDCSDAPSVGRGFVGHGSVDPALLLS